ncbi:MAG TPA: FAD-dependent thymidylate synthase [Dehalococcoidia bacterium]|nr:FAD-dependent thymidylate synthase [Dehalococcoidia bacterium]
MADSAPQTYQRRVYPLDAHALTEEQIAVAFAMTSRRPESFDDIARQVSQEKAADFHERWVLGYGHASVAEHAVVHLAVENISRLAADTLEDNRLASYTEKSSRYQVLPPDGYHVPRELASQPDLDQVYRAACRRLFQAYQYCLDRCQEHLQGLHPREAGERETAYRLRLRRTATDSCRAVLPAATLTNVGVTANARVLEHAITKLLSSELAEEQDLGQEIKQEARRITPTLIKYAEPNAYLRQVAQRRREWASNGALESQPAVDGFSQVRLVHWDAQAEVKLAAALLYRGSHLSYDALWQRVQAMDAQARQEVIGQCLSQMGPHDAPVRELELVDYTFEFVLDYGAYREFKRHRMQTYLAQPLTVAHGHCTPELLVQSGVQDEFEAALAEAEAAYGQVHQFSPDIAQYLATHAHYRRVLSKLNLRECYHLFKLRTSLQAHEAIRGPMRQALELAQQTHPALFRYLRLRE